MNFLTKIPEYANITNPCSLFRNEYDEKYNYMTLLREAEIASR